MNQFRLWFADHGRGKCMYHIVSHKQYITVAFSDPNDCVLFRLTFADIRTKVVTRSTTAR
jgi:hypothetical protein